MRTGSRPLPRSKSWSPSAVGRARDRRGKAGRLSPAQVGAELVGDLENLASTDAMSRDQVAFESLAPTRDVLPDALARVAG